MTSFRTPMLGIRKRIDYRCLFTFGESCFNYYGCYVTLCVYKVTIKIKITSMSLTASHRIESVQDPIIPIVGQWISENPGTVSLGQGIVWYGPPAQIEQGIAEFNQNPDNHVYKAVHGIPQLLSVIERKLELDNQIKPAGNRKVVVTAGGNLAFSNAVFAIADPGDEFILSVPFYFNHEMAISMANCKSVLVATDENYQLDLRAIEASVGPKTKAVVTVSPGNPTGVVLSTESLIAVNKLCKRMGIFHIHDEAYEYFHYGDSEQFSPASVEGSEPHTISLYSLSKSFGFASWRIGYMLIPNALFHAILKIQDTQLICAPVISQFAAVAAMRAGRKWCYQQQETIRESRSIVVSALDEITDICTYPKSMGAFYFYLKINTEISSIDVCERLIKEYGVAVIPGVTFGSSDGTYLRIAYGAMTPESAGQAIQRFVSGITAIVKD